MNKQLLLEKIEGSYNKEQLKGWVKALQTEAITGPVRPKIGDVYMHPCSRIL